MNAELKTPWAGRQREIFLNALDKTDPAERAAYLAEACGQDRELRKAVDELLREAPQVDGFLETPALASGQASALGPADTAVLAAITEKPGDTIGNYKLLQNIGEGGCGVVYMADQERPIRRRVALKIIKLGMDTKQVIARFDAERQAVAMMDHPNIAKVYDAGATDTGRPYFVMELVRGIKITDYCDQNRLSTEERLKLFAQVCHAIQHAHQKGIIHRDVKPSNILVTLHDGTPVPKVIDFGVAKATNQQRLTDLTVFTAFEQFIGTPAYMSPEQAEMSGLDIDTRSDIYSLGVLLYELLTGKTPFDPEALLSGGLDECRRTIRFEEPARPSNRLGTMLEADLTTTASRRGTEPPRLLHLLRGDLDWVVMKCLEKDRTRRYATANELAMDIERYLDGEPVLARPPSTFYRFQKFARRHRAAFAATAAIAGALVIGAAISTWQAIRARQAEDRAEAAQLQEALLRRQAENGWDRARENLKLARLNEYVADINLAQQASLVAGNYGRAVQLLLKHLPQPGEPDLRGFEWRYLWRLCQGDTHQSLPAQEGTVQLIAYSPDGQWLAVALRDKLNVWNLQTKTLVTSLPGDFVSIAFSPDGKRLFTAGMPRMMRPPWESSNSPEVRVWSTADWSEQKRLERSSGPFALSKDGACLAVNSRQGVRLWNTANWEEMTVLREAWTPLAFSPDGKLLATESRAGQGITLWQVQDGTVRQVLAGSTNLLSRQGPWFRAGGTLAFSPDGRFIAAAQNTRSEEHGVFVLLLWDLETGQQTAMPEDPEHIEHTGLIFCLAFSPDSRLLATASLDHSVRLWSLASRRCIATLQGHLNEVWAVAFAPDGRSLASGAKDGSLFLWQTFRSSREDALSGTWEPLAFSKDSRTLVALDRSGKFALIDVTTREPVQEIQLEPRRRFGSAVSVSADLKTMAEGLDDGRVRLWNLQTRETILLRAGDHPTGLIALSPDGRDLVTGGFGQALRWWKLADSSNTTLDTHADQVLFSPDSHTLAAITRATGVELWDAATRSLRLRLTTEALPGRAAAFSPDSRLLATTADFNEVDQGISLWEVATGKLIGTCTGHKQPVLSVAFSSDSRTLASASDDSTLKFWNVATQQEMLSLRRLGGALNGLVFSPDGQLLAAASNRPMQSNALQFYHAPQPADTLAVP